MSPLSEVCKVANVFISVEEVYICYSHHTIHIGAAAVS